MTNWTKNSWDIHVHAAPSLFERWGTAGDLAQACRDAEMVGFVLKFHHGSSVEIASAINDQFPELSVYGGVTLNHFVGGLNPYAVETALRLGGKIIWLPTIHAAEHGKACGCLGGFGFQGSKVKKVPEEGLTILDETLNISDSVKEILALLHQQPVVLATGHISSAEIAALHSYIEANRLDIRLLINHVFFKTPSLTLPQIKELIRPWVWFETVYLCISPLVQCTTAEHIAQSLLALPEANWIMASDSGQAGNPKSPEALSLFASQLQQHGVSETRLRRMLRQAPEALLG